jgi:predicted chitinase
MSVKGAVLAAGVPRGIADAEAPRAELAMREFEITNQARASMWLAQVLHESLGLRFFEEIADGSAYEGRRDLGNIHPGDGRRYKGRGPIQLTGRANYRFVGSKLGLDLEREPEVAARHDIGWRIAGFFWANHGLNALADRDEFETITRRINGGLNGFESRKHYLALVSRVDCRPIDRWEGFTSAERRWIHEYDHLLAGHRNPDRRRALRAAMTEQRKRIWRAAQPESEGGDGKGWGHASRKKRYEALRKRTS